MSDSEKITETSSRSNLSREKKPSSSTVDVDQVATSIIEPWPQAVYDPTLADQAVQLRRLLRDKRFWSTLSTLSNLLSTIALDRLIKNKKRTKAEQAKERAKRIKEAFLDLGATFIKLGQFLSVRKDIISEELAEELASLQDQVPPFDVETLKAIITRELSGAPESLYLEFEEKPIASASIGQVHLAKLKDGRKVVVKVQRPELSETFYQDLGYMRFIARIGPLIRPSADWTSWLALSDEFGRTLFEEIDYIKEGRNADRIRLILKEHNALRIPRVYWKLTGRRVLTLEYLPGVKIDRHKELASLGIDPVAIGNNLVGAYMEQVLTHGFFHADPHAGNLAVGPDGKIVIYDFGMVSEISQLQREAILGCIASVINCNPQELVKNLVNLGIVKGGAHQASLERAVNPFIEYYKGKQIRELDFSHLEHDIDQIASDRALKLPPSLAYLLRTASSLEGIARSLHPNFSFVQAAKPTVKKWALANPGQAYLALGYLTQAKLLGQKGVFSEEGLVKLFNTKTLSDNDVTQSTKRNKKSPSAPLHEEELNREISRRREENRRLETQLYILHRELKAHSQNRVNLLWLSVIWFLMSFLFWALAKSTESHQISEYYLIGNGVMVAVIIWQIVKPLSLTKSKKSDRSRDRRR
jgi:predicted unusual protein kinase regulating ubiquinone biosynthesis (AarF/ABC1/UbiB family)